MDIAIYLFTIFVVRLVGFSSFGKLKQKDLENCWINFMHGKVRVANGWLPFDDDG